MQTILWGSLAGVAALALFFAATPDAGTDAPTSKAAGRTTLATFAGGCFWCMEHPFEDLDGVLEVVSGYTGGTTPNPSYEQVSAGITGHAEAVQIRYDPTRIDYARLLDIFWRQIDPTDAGGQFVDRGSQYRTGIFHHDEEQRRLAEASRAALAASGRYDRPIVTPIEPAGVFYPAEEYHQDYARKHPLKYRYYRYGSGRDRYLARIWGDTKETAAPTPASEARDAAAAAPAASDERSARAAEAPVVPAPGPYRKPSEAELRARLTELQYDVTQRDATERPFANAYWNSKAEGIYVDVVSGEPLFSSRDKFESGTGWPSFVRPLEPANIVERTDQSLFTRRTEVRSKHADSHLGHVFDDGPPPTGQRYCINSAALRFVPKDALEQEGYGRYRALFDD